MTLPTCNVLCSVYDDAGQPVQGATVSAKLNQFEVYLGYVVPTLIEGTTDATGQATLALWPNQLGSTESMYTVKISSPNGKRLTVNAIVPNVSSAYLHEIAELPPYDGKTDGQLILDAAIAAGSVAVAAASEAAASATSAAASANTASSAATTASGAVTTATTKATEAASSATSAATSASTATSAAASIGNSVATSSNAAAAAAASATTASTKAGEASTSATSAASSANTANTAATTATTKANEAANSATTASTAATSASSSASTATTAATNAGTSATAASNSATAAASSATSAANSANTATTKASEASTSAGTASTAATSASTSATNAATSATTATTQATSAASSATAAATSATSAANSATSASGSASTATTAATTATTQASIATNKAADAEYWAAQAEAIAAAAGGIRYNVAQSLTSPQQAQARGNIGIDFMPYNATNPSGYINTDGARSAISVTGYATYDPATGVINVVGGGGGGGGGDVISVNGYVGIVNLNKSDIGLSNVDNKSSATIRGEITSANVTTALGFTPANAASLATVATTGAYSDLTGKPTLFSGAYADLTGKPTLFSGAYADLTGKPTNVSAFTNDAGYLTGITSSQVTTALGFVPEDSSKKNAINGYAGLDSSGLIPSSLLPSYVDDVLEYANFAGLPGTGTAGKIYVTLDTNKTYRWSGSAYVEISASPGSTDAVTEGSTNLYFTTARARSSISVTQNLTYNSSTGVITGPDLSGYLTSATAASTYQTVAGMSSYLTTTNAASTYQTISGMSSYALIAGPTFTGTVAVNGSANNLTIAGSATGNFVTIGANGTDSSIGIKIQPKVSGSFIVENTAAIRAFMATPIPNSVNYLQVASSVAGAGALIQTVGTDTDIGILYYAKGAGSHSFGNPNNIQFVVSSVASAVNYLYATGSATNNNVVLGALGTDTNIGIALTVKGTGVVTALDAPLTRAMLKDIGWTFYDHTGVNGSSNHALDFTNGIHQRWAPVAGTTAALTVSNWPPSGNLGELLIEGVNLAAAPASFSGINWVKSDGTVTTTFASSGVTLQTSGTDFILLWTRDAGTTTYGKVVR